MKRIDEVELICQVVIAAVLAVVFVMVVSVLLKEFA